MVEVSVSDIGVGIAPRDQEAVFEEFRQVKTAGKKVEGTGLGLTLCRTFVELHGGKDLGAEPGGPGLEVHLYNPGSSRRVSSPNPGMGHVAVGLHSKGYDFQLTRSDEPIRAG